MKKLKFLLCALFAVLCCTALTACGDDDDEPSNPLVGTWTDMDWAYYGDSRVLTFNSNGTYSEQWVEDSNTGTETGVYSLSGTSLVMTETWSSHKGAVNETSVYTIAINGSTALVTDSHGETVTWIKK